LKYEAALAHRAIAQACTVGLGTVSSYLTRATAAGLTWPLPDGLDDAALEARLFARPADPAHLDRTVPEWPHLHQELKRAGVTLQLLWTEYRAAHPTGYAYGHFCDRYCRWARVLKPSMRRGASRRRETVSGFLRPAAVARGRDDRQAGAGRTLRRRAGAAFSARRAAVAFVASTMSLVFRRRWPRRRAAKADSEFVITRSRSFNSTITGCFRRTPFPIAIAWHSSIVGSASA
jgi:hypothetical protein